MPPRKRKSAAATEEQATPRTRRMRNASPAPESNSPVQASPEPVEEAEPTVATPRRRGRPAKPASEKVTKEPTGPPRKRGRPPKAATAAVDVDEDSSAEPAPKRRSGRPRKAVAEETAASEEEEVAPKRRGRPPKAAKETSDATEAPKKRGRPARTAPAKVDETNGNEAPKRRGRPPGKTTSAAIAKSAAPYTGKKRGRPAKNATPAAPYTGKKRGRPAKQATSDEAPAPKKRRGRPSKNAAAQDSDLEARVDDDDDEPAAESEKENAVEEVEAEAEAEVEDEDEDEADAEDAKGQASYWLMKAEPESRMETTASGKQVDIAFSIDDLAEKGGPEAWDGIRNHVARGNLRKMKVGDLCFFAESNCKVPGIVGIMEVVGTAVPDPLQFNPDSPYYDPKATEDSPRWDCVYVEFRRKFKAKLPSSKLKEHAVGGPLADLQLLRQSRLSVSGITPAEWDFIINLATEVEAEAEAAGPSSSSPAKPKKTPRKKAAAARATPGTKRRGAKATTPAVEDDDDDAPPSAQVQASTPPPADADAAAEGPALSSPLLANDAPPEAPQPTLASPFDEAERESSPLSDVDGDGDGVVEGATGFLGRIGERIGRVMKSPARVSRALSLGPDDEEEL